MSLIGGKWKILILKLLMLKKYRFGEIKRELHGISAKVLTDQLNEMIEDGIVFKKIYAEVPPRTEYSLSPLGISLVPILRAMGMWGNVFKQNYDKEIISEEYFREELVKKYKAELELLSENEDEAFMLCAE